MSSPRVRVKKATCAHRLCIFFTVLVIGWDGIMPVVFSEPPVDSNTQIQAPHTIGMICVSGEQRAPWGHCPHESAGVPSKQGRCSALDSHPHKVKKNIFPAPCYNASCCEGLKKKITDFFPLKKEYNDFNWCSLRGRNQWAAGVRH